MKDKFWDISQKVRKPYDNNLDKEKKGLRISNLRKWINECGYQGFLIN